MNIVSIVSIVNNDNHDIHGNHDNHENMEFKMKSLKCLILTLVAICIIVPNLAGCTKTTKLNVGLVDQQTLIADWPLYRDMAIEYQRENVQLRSNLNFTTTLNEAQKKKIEVISKKWKKNIEDLNRQVSKASRLVIKKRNLDIVIWKQRVEYGGQDITSDVLKYLKKD